MFCILTFDEHFGKAHSVRLRIDLLTEQPNIRRGIITFDEVIAAGKHAARATVLIQYGDNLHVIQDVIATISQQDVAMGLTISRLV